MILGLDLTTNKTDYNKYLPTLKGVKVQSVSTICHIRTKLHVRVKGLLFKLGLWRMYGDSLYSYTWV